MKRGTKAVLGPVHPGEILLEDFMKILGISINKLARELVVPPNRISEIVNGKRSITPDTALRLYRYFGIDAQFWLNLQSEYDLRVTLLSGDSARMSGDTLGSWLDMVSDRTFTLTDITSDTPEEVTLDVEIRRNSSGEVLNSRTVFMSADYTSA